MVSFWVQEKFTSIYPSVLFWRTKCLISGNVILCPVNLAAGESDGSLLRKPEETIECDFSWLYESIQINAIINHLLSHKPASALLFCGL